jgi:uncharacterized membrane protein YheB (UPF0754 family)
VTLMIRLVYRLCCVGLPLAALVAIGLRMVDAPGAHTLFVLAVSGLVGFGTNYLAVKMLFIPRQPIWGVQGLVPARRHDIAVAVARQVESKLINVDSLLEHLRAHGVYERVRAASTARLDRFITDDAFAADLVSQVEVYIHPYLPVVTAWVADRIEAELEDAEGARDWLVKKGIRVGLKVKGVAFDRLPAELEAALRDFIAAPENREQLIATLRNWTRSFREDLQEKELDQRLGEQLKPVVEEALAALDLQALIVNRLDQLPLPTLERMIIAVCGRELAGIQALGGVLGVLGGALLLI